MKIKPQVEITFDQEDEKVAKVMCFLLEWAFNQPKFNSKFIDWFISEMDKERLGSPNIKN